MVSKMEHLASLLAAPQKVTQQDTALLKDLVQIYPYYQPLHLLLAKANMNQPEQGNILATAALYTNGTLLHNVVFNADALPYNSLVVVENKAITPHVSAPKESVKDQVISEPLPIEENADGETVAVPKQTEAESQEEEVYEEIGEVNIYDFVQEQPAESVRHDPEPVSIPEELEDKMMLESIVSSDFFAFEKSFTTEPVTGEIQEEKITPKTESDTPEEKEEESRVTNYHDDKLPYTFLWWLAKTRKEHQSVFQPYASPKRQYINALQQQYVENIFHIQSPFNPEEILNTSSAIPGADPREVAIIDNFIKNAPQISTPNAEQIDNENKAKRSAEDNYDLVTETLAKIYIEQMLYHKAIDTYEKLCLKFPEKSRYFADLIQSIKKKI